MTENTVIFANPNDVEELKEKCEKEDMCCLSAEGMPACIRNKTAFEFSLEKVPQVEEGAKAGLKSKMLNWAERKTGLDLDGDGDVGIKGSLKKGTEEGEETKDKKGFKFKMFKKRATKEAKGEKAEEKKVEVEEKKVIQAELKEAEAEEKKVEKAEKTAKAKEKELAEK